MINKIDLLGSESVGSEASGENPDGETPDCSGRELLEAVTYLYESIGYKVVHISAKTGEGIDTLRHLLDGKITLVSGNSGVGKSTLINNLIPGLDLRTAEISDVHDTGRHTTTFRAVSDHRIAQSRYNSYLSILADSDDDKYRKPF